MKLPFQSNKKKQSKSQPAADSPSISPTRFSLNSQMLLLMVVGVLMVAIPPTVIYVQSVLKLKAARQAQSEFAAETIASSLRQWVDHQIATAELVVEDPQVVRTMKEDADRERTRKADSLAYFFPSALRVRLLPPGFDKVDSKTKPPISYAALDMLRHAETRDTPPPVELHMGGTPQEHLNVLRPIPDISGQRIVGHLMVSFPVQELEELLSLQPAGGYVEIQQTVSSNTVVAARRGDAALKRAEPDSHSAAEGSRWRVAYWGERDSGAGQSFLITTAIVTVAAVLLLAGAVLLVFSKMGSALRSDQATLLTIVKDMRDGRVQAQYPNMLDDMRGTVELAARTARGAVRTEPPVSVARPIEKKADQPVPASRQVVDEVKDDLLFDDSPLEVDRLEAEGHKVVPTIFRAYDIRGIVGDTLTAEVAFEIGRAIGSEAYYRGEQTVVVGRDGRVSGPTLAEALIRGLKATGRDVRDIGQVPTPVLYFAAQHLDANSGVMVTGSHNPSNYNGFKIVLGGETLANSAIQGLRQRIETGDMLTGGGSVEQAVVLPDYIARIKSDVRVARPLKVVVDCGNGVAGEAAPALLRALGCDVTELFCDIDGDFPNHHPDPSKPENLDVLVQTVLDKGADLGVAFDGDGDRLGVVSSQGAIIWPDRLLMLFAKDVLSRNPGAQIIYDVKCSRHVAAVIGQYGGEPLMSATGHSVIKARMKETGALLAGEMSGHIFFKERWFGFDDALYSAARLVEILANDARTSSEVFAELPDSMNTPELNVPMGEGEAHSFMHKLLECARFDNARIATLDGLRVEFADGWGLVRASNTTPCLVLRFEADHELALHRIQEEFRRVLLQVDPNLSLPF
jgi:phosphomannomutase/phosphoglucomutase